MLGQPAAGEFTIDQTQGTELGFPVVHDEYRELNCQPHS